jgi:hypothetical protein
VGYLCQQLERLTPECNEQAGIERWQPVDDNDYRPIRDIMRHLPNLNI